MIELIREPYQSNWVLLLFLGAIFIYVFLHNTDSRRFVYFFRSIYNKQYQINYGRHTKISDLFNVLFSLASILSASFLLSSFMKYCSTAPYFDYLYLDALVILLFFIGMKWLAIFLFSFLFKQQKIFIEFSSLSLRYTNLVFTPISIVSMYLYLIDWFSHSHLSILLSVTLAFLVAAKIKVLVRITAVNSFEFSHIILYLCTFEIAPFLWLLIALNC